MQISGRAPELSLEQREKRKMAKRIIKAIQPALEDAIRKESELNRQPFEQELKDLDVMLENSLLSARGSEIDSAERAGDDTFEKHEKMEVTESTVHEVENAPDASAKLESQDETMEDPADEILPEVEGTQPPATSSDPQAMDIDIPDGTSALPNADSATSLPIQPPSETHPVTMDGTPAIPEQPDLPVPDQVPEAPKVPLSPPILQSDQQHPLSQGGIQWYMQPFDPIGTTIHEERWTGREVMRGLSEELSELDEDELKDLVADDELEESAAGADASGSGAQDNSGGEQGVKIHRTRRRWRGFK
jgi:NuA3 HAT complex component NTO1